MKHYHIRIYSGSSVIKRNSKYRFSTAIMLLLCILRHRAFQGPAFCVYAKDPFPITNLVVRPFVNTACCINCSESIEVSEKLAVVMELLMQSGFVCSSDYEWNHWLPPKEMLGVCAEFLAM
jgi:hypothetical protein